jgi:hypothetical protein
LYPKKEIPTKIGNTQIVHLSDNIGITYHAFSTSVIKKELINKTGDLYSRSTGKSQNKKYYGFDLGASKGAGQF